MELSKTQQDCLQELKKEGAFLHYMAYCGRFNPSAYYFSHGSMKHYRESTVSKLIKMGYAMIRNDDGYSKHEVVWTGKITPEV